jgi:hypothetical protein
MRFFAVFPASSSLSDGNHDCKRKIGDRNNSSVYACIAQSIELMLRLIFGTGMLGCRRFSSMKQEAQEQCLQLQGAGEVWFALL